MNETSAVEGYHKLWTSFRNLGHLMDRVREKELGKYGLTTSQAGMLHHVRELGDAATPAAIARIQHREATSVSSLLIRMEKQGLVKRTRDMARKNQVRIYLTEKGEQAIANASIRESPTRILSQLSDADRQEMTRITDFLRRIVIGELADIYRNNYLDNFNLPDEND
jgi:DNA-binding MarR family transcriptional regulator